MLASLSSPSNLSSSIINSSEKTYFNSNNVKELLNGGPLADIVEDSSAFITIKARPVLLKVVKSDTNYRAPAVNPLCGESTTNELSEITSLYVNGKLSEAGLKLDNITKVCQQEKLFELATYVRECSESLDREKQLVEINRLMSQAQLNKAGYKLEDLGKKYVGKKQFVQAALAFQSSAECYIQLKNYPSAACRFSQAAESYLKTGFFRDAAESYLRSSCSHQLSVNINIKAVAYSYEQTGKAWVKSKCFSSAAEVFNQSALLYLQLDNFKSAACRFLQMAKACIQSGGYERAKEAIISYLVFNGGPAEFSFKNENILNKEQLHDFNSIFQEALKEYKVRLASA